jgi:hypothetical protein
MDEKGPQEGEIPKQIHRDLTNLLPNEIIPNLMHPNSTTLFPTAKGSA